MVKKFIDRPILSLVISIFILLLGLLSLFNLPISQFPEIVPPCVTVTAKYTGANAEVCAKAVATPLERAINGVPGMTYMSTVSGNNGTTIITVNFKVGTDPDLAAVGVQNRVQTVIDELPEEVIKAGVSTEKEVNSMLLYLNILSTDSTMDEKFVYNFTDGICSYSSSRAGYGGIFPFFTFLSLQTKIPSLKIHQLTASY